MGIAVHVDNLIRIFEADLPGGGSIEVAFEAADAPSPPSTRARFEFDPVSGRLSFEFPADVAAASLHRAGPGPDADDATAPAKGHGNEPGPARRNKPRA